MEGASREVPNLKITVMFGITSCSSIYLACTLLVD